MKISILTLFPEMFSGPFDYSIVKRAQAQKIVEINYVNIREFGIGEHKSVDDKPYGGGTGMILKVDVLDKAILKAMSDFIREKNPPASQASPPAKQSEAARARALRAGQKVVLLGAHGKTFNQKIAKNLSKLKHLILICGHYEGVDERVKKLIDMEISIGDFIVTGGEIPSMLIVDAVVRLMENVLKKGVTDIESFSPLLEYPQYTRPKTYKNMTVPDILTNGNHPEILKWRKKASMRNTKKLRPDIPISGIMEQKD